MPKKTVSEAKAAAKNEGASAVKAREEKLKYNNRPKTRYISSQPKFDGYWVRILTDQAEKHGVPCDPDGKKMVPGPRLSGGLSTEARAAKAKLVAEKEAKFAKMSDAEKLEFANKERELRKQQRKEKAAHRREAMIAQIKAEIKAGTISL